MICDKCMWDEHKHCKEHMTSLSITAHEIAIEFANKADTVKDSMRRYVNMTTYEEKMIDVRSRVKRVFERLHTELVESEREICKSLRRLIDGEKMSDSDKRIQIERTSEYQLVETQISAMRNEVDQMIENANYARVFNERNTLKKFMDAIEVVNNDLQNHIDENRQPVGEITSDLKYLVQDIKACTEIQKVKFEQYKHIGIPSRFFYKPFTIFFKKFKRKIIENNKELSLLDAGIYCLEKWGMMGFEEQQKYIKAATEVNNKISKNNKNIYEQIEPDFRRIKEQRDRRVREEKERILVDHFSNPPDIDEIEEFEQDAEEFKIQQDPVINKKRDTKAMVIKDEQDEKMTRKRMSTPAFSRGPYKKRKKIDDSSPKNSNSSKYVHIRNNEDETPLSYYGITQPVVKKIVRLNGSTSNYKRSNEHNFEIEQNQITVNEIDQIEEENLSRRKKYRTKSKDEKKVDESPPSSDSDPKPRPSYTKPIEIEEKYVRDIGACINPPPSTHIRKRSRSIEQRTGQESAIELTKKIEAIKVQDRAAHPFKSLIDPEVMDQRNTKQLMRIKMQVDDLKTMIKRNDGYYK